MKARALTIEYPISGVGVLQEVEYRFPSLIEALNGGGLPVRKFWITQLERSQKSPKRPDGVPGGFRGWHIADRYISPGQTFLIYSSEQSLAAALNEGTLIPEGGPELLERWDLRAKNRRLVSKSRLVSRRSVLRSLGVVPRAFLDTNNLRDVRCSRRSSDEFDFDFFEDGSQSARPAPEPDQAVLLREADGLGWAGKILMFMLPVDCTFRSGVTVRRARWLAKFPRRPKSEHQFPFPLLYFDGHSRSWLSAVDGLGREDVRDFERSSTMHLVEEARLMPPSTLLAKYVFRRPGSGEQRSEKSEGDVASLPPGLVAIPAFSSVAVDPNLTRLEGMAAAAAWREQERLTGALDIMPSTTGDIFLCERCGLYPAGSKPITITRQTSFLEDPW